MSLMRKEKAKFDDPSRVNYAAMREFLWNSGNKSSAPVQQVRSMSKKDSDRFRHHASWLMGDAWTQG